MISFKDYLEEKKKNPCWDGYKKVPGKKDYEEDSCVKEGYDDHEQIAKELIKRHGKNITKQHIKDIEDERDSRGPLDHDEVMSHVKKLSEAAIDAKGYKSSTGGLTQKGVDAYNRKTGGHLQMAVTTPPSKLKKGSKAANRRKSFCARMSGVDGPMKKPNGEPTRKALALRKWNC